MAVSPTCSQSEESDMHPYKRLVAFVNDNLDHFMRKFECGPQVWSIDEWTKVVSDCFYTMNNISFYYDDDAVVEDHCMTYEGLYAAFVWALENYRIDDEAYHIVERNEGVMTLLARAIKDDILYEE